MVLPSLSRTVRADGDSDAATRRGDRSADGPVETIRLRRGGAEWAVARDEGRRGGCGGTEAAVYEGCIIKEDIRTVSRPWPAEGRWV